MHVLIIGAAGMIGRKLANRLARDGGLGGRPVDRLTMVDIAAPETPTALGARASVSATDITAPEEALRLASLRPDVIFHLAAIVSGEAEADFDKGYRVNLDSVRAFLEAIRAVGQTAPYCPRLVFTSSIAVFGAPFPDSIGDEFHTTPLTSYGTQKAIGELLLNDYARRGFVDGIGIRLPTICVRPGAPNRAASGFFSNILREPMSGREAILPVGEEIRHCHASPRAAVGFLLHAATLDTSALGARRCLSMPSLSVTVGEQIAALTRVAGPRAAALIRREPDPTIARIVAGWPQRIAADRAKALGFQADADFDSIIRIHIEDELAGRLAV